MTLLTDIFRPTRAKIILSVFVGPALTVAGLFITGMARHGPRTIQYIMLPLTIPYGLVVWLNLTNEYWWIALLIPTLAYWYVIFSLGSYLRSRFR